MVSNSLRYVVPQELMYAVLENEGQTISYYSYKINKQHPNVSKLFKMLESDGLVELKRVDGTSKNIYLTEKGRQYAKAVKKIKTLDS